MSDRKPWERQKGESRKAFQAFALYRDMGPARSLAKVAQQLNKSKTLLGRWSERWNWVERAQAWDDEVDRRKREARLKAIEEMNERQAKEALAMQQKAIERLKRMDPDELDPKDVVNYLINAAKLERTARGEPEEITERRVKRENDESSTILEQLLRRHPELIDEIYRLRDGQDRSAGQA